MAASGTSSESWLGPLGFSEGKAGPPTTKITVPSLEVVLGLLPWEGGGSIQVPWVPFDHVASHSEESPSMRGRRSHHPQPVSPAQQHSARTRPPHTAEQS